MQGNQNTHGDIQFQSSKPRFFSKKNKDQATPGSAPQINNLVTKEETQPVAAAPVTNGTTQLNSQAKPFISSGTAQPTNGTQQEFKRKTIPQENQQQQEKNSDDEDKPEDNLRQLQQEQESNQVMPNFVPPTGEFHEFPEIPRRTVESLQAKGYASLFAIQQHCFYPVYQRQDLVARDLTGSGKTFAFGLPCVEYLRKQKQLGTRKVQAIVLAPTRELALQVTNEMAKLKHYDNEFKIVTVYGGVNIDDQIRQLKQGVDIFVGTTGRVLDHIERGNIDFSSLKTIILDEADQMLKLGFKEDVDKIMRSIREVIGDPAKLQICLFSATIPNWVKGLARQYMKRGFMVVDLAVDLKNKTAKEVNHLAIECPYQNRMSALADVLIVYGNDAKTIVFTQTKQDANSLILSDKIKQAGVEVMHGDIAQSQREVTIKRFKEGKFKVLVATDVASRGLDIKDVDLVIQIEPPKDTETYIHRSGRTARAGKSGTCITFYTKKTYEFVQRIEDQAGIRLKRIGVPQPEMVIKASSRGILKNLLEVNEEVLTLFEDLAKDLINQHDGNAEKALQVALAYCSGHYKHQLVSKSLLNGQENQLTLRMSTQKGRMTTGNCFYNIKKYWDPRTAENIRNMKAFKDGSGCVFDIRSENFEAFMDNYTRLRETDSRIDFDITKCTDLPDLDDDQGYNQNWRDNKSQADNYGGGQKGGNYNNNYRNNDRDGGSRGGYDRGYQGQSSRGGGGYGGQRGDRRGGYQSNDNHRGGDRDGGAGWSKPSSYQNRDREYEEGGSSNSYAQSSWSRQGQSAQQSSYQPRGGGQAQDFRPRTAVGSSGHAPLVGKKASGQNTFVFVSNLKFQLNEQDIMDFFRENSFKAIRARLLYDNEGNSKGTSFVEMNSKEEADEAVAKLNNIQYEGRKLIVSIANNNN